MGQEFVWLVKRLLLPPAGLILLGLFGMVAGRNRWWGRPLTAATLIGLYLLSTPFLANSLMQEIESYPALTDKGIAQSNAEAIVVLGGGRRHNAPEYGGETVGPLLLERIRYAAYLARRTGLPVIPSGGSPQHDGPSAALLTKNVLEQEFGVTVGAPEGQSRTTWENAQMTAEQLQRKGIDRVLLVSHAMHMRRAVAAFEYRGIKVTPAPTAFYHTNDDLYQLSDWLPDTSALQSSYFALHEMLGAVWYALRQHWQEWLQPSQQAVRPL